MPEIFHILNGDSLLEQFPDHLLGEKIIARECLMDGPSDLVDLDLFFEQRAHFISDAFGFPEKEYYEKTQSEFEKILKLPSTSTVNLWFEKDLFCQVNLWFVCHLLNRRKHSDNIFLILANDLEMGFGGMDSKELANAYKNRTKLSEQDLVKFDRLWRAFGQKDFEVLQNIGNELSKEFPFLNEAIQAEIDRQPGPRSLGKPLELLKDIITEKQTSSMKIIFPVFQKKAAIYGFGDLQVLKMIDHLTQKIQQ